MKKGTSFILIVIAGLVLLNLASYHFYFRKDLTEDQRYSLSEASREILNEVDRPLIFDVFLSGSFTAEFRRLRNETRQMLEEYSAYNSNIIINFTDPLAEGGDANQVAEEFFGMGMTPVRIQVKENGKSSEDIVFPWATANYGDNTVRIPLLKNQIGATDEERVTASVQQLEYAISNGISKLVFPKRKKVAVMRGNGELPDVRITDFVKTLQEYYFIAPFTLDSVEANPQKTLEDLKEYDLVIDPKPTQAFTEKEKFVLDQYLMNGGNMVWLAEMTNMETDSLFNPEGIALALPRDLNLMDYFFSYGVRINPQLVNDLYSAPIVLATGEGSETRFNPYPWFYSPLTASTKDHPIVKNIEAVKFDYANPIDTLKNDVKKTILLTSSPRSKIEGVPMPINLDMVNSKPDMASYTEQEIPLAVLLEGKFKSVYKNRIKPFDLPGALDDGKAAKMLVISDGDVIKNDIQQGRPLELGFQRYSGNVYGNKEFLLNAVNYMLDDNGLISLRSKEINLPFLDMEKVQEERQKWQFITIAAPLLILLIFGLGYSFFRKRSNRVN